MTYIKVNDTLYPATVSGKTQDREWDNRESKAITLDGDFATVDALFSDGTAWSIVQETIETVEGEEKTTQTEYDNSKFYVRGDLTAHVDGTCTVKMGKPTDLEDAYELLYGGV